MVTVRPFHALRPQPPLAPEVVAMFPNGQIVNLADVSPNSFLHILHGEDGGADVAHAQTSFRQLVRNKILEYDKRASLFLYSLQTNSHSQTGVVGCFSLDDYNLNLIRKHEETRPDKEEYCARLMLTLEAHESPVFLIYQDQEEIRTLIEQEKKSPPLYDFKTSDGTHHTVWRIKEEDSFRKHFAVIPHVYIADGHHRIAAANYCRELLKKKNKNHTGNEEYNYFLATVFPHTDVKIHAYNRLIRALSKTKEEILSELRRVYTVKEGVDPIPEAKGECFMYLDHTWYGLLLPKKENSTDPAKNLEVSVLYERALKPIFGITDPRTDPNIDYVSGTRGTKELEELVDSGSVGCAFCLFPTSIQELMEISDLGLTMEPKSTWFEPKLSFGLLIHPFSGDFQSS